MSRAEKASPDVNDALDPAKALVPATVRLNEQIVTRGFWPKIRRVAARVPFAADALAAWYAVQDRETPTAAKGMMLAGLAYFVLPTDLIPDFIAGLGYTDDAAVLMAMLGLVGRHIQPRHKAAAHEAVERLRER